MFLKKWGRVAAVTMPIILGACAGSHDETSNLVQSATVGNNFDAGIAQLDARFKSASAKKEVLYNLEKGELLRLAGKYEESNVAFLQADESVKKWESSAASGAKAAGTLGAALISERLKTYEGHDYEKVWLTTRLALNRISLGDFDGARVDIKRTHEREAIIQRVRSGAVAAAEADAQKNGAKSEAKELSGYPTESLNDPEVLTLKNGYQNALSHYLAGFLYESLNEPSMAAPGYRAAIELHPGSSLLEEGLRGLDERTGAAKQSQAMTDVLLVVETGVAPARVPKSFSVPIPTGVTIPVVTISYPVITPSNDPPLQALAVDQATLQFDKVVDLNVMARRELKDEMPGMILRGITRGITKGVMQDQLQKQAGIWGALAGAAFSAVTEQADDRMWRMLPDRVYVARTRLAPGEHDLTVNGQSVKINVSGQYAMVPVRVYEGTTLVGQPGVIGQLANRTVAAQ